MTTDQNHNDPRVSETYRDLANERTPPELDRKVLSMAAAGTRSRYGLARAWIRPVAWAATIGLSLAFVLELSQVREVAERIDAPVAKQVSDPPAAAESQAAPQPVLENTSVSADFEADDMGILREAEEQVRARSGSERPESATPTAAVAERQVSAIPAEAAADRSQPAAPAAAVTFMAEKKEKIGHCDEDARVTAATWYTCILELRDSERTEAADQEFEKLLERFPDFEEPEASR